MVKFVALIVQQFYLLAFVVKVCWFFSCLVATVKVLLSTAILVFRQRCVFHVYNKVQIRVCLSKLCLVLFLPLTFWCKKYRASK